MSSGGLQEIKNVSITKDKISFLTDTSFPPEEFDGVRYGVGTVVSVTTINRVTGELKKIETIKEKTITFDFDELKTTTLDCSSSPVVTDSNNLNDSTQSVFKSETDLSHFSVTLSSLNSSAAEQQQHHEPRVGSLLPGPRASLEAWASPCAAYLVAAAARLAHSPRRDLAGLARQPGGQGTAG